MSRNYIYTYTAACFVDGENHEFSDSTEEGAVKSAINYLNHRGSADVILITITKTLWWRQPK